MTGKVTNTRQKKSKQNENPQIILNFAEKPDALPVLTEHLVYRFATDSKIVFICATGVEDGKSAPAQEWPGVEPGCLSLSRCDAHMLDRLAVLPEQLHYKSRRYQLEKCTVASYMPLDYILSQVGTHYSSNVSPSGRDVQLK